MAAPAATRDARSVCYSHFPRSIMTRPRNAAEYCRQSTSGPLAQLVEHWTFNPLVAGSIPARPTKFQRSIPVTSVTVYTESLDLEELKGGFEAFEVLKVTSAESPVHAQLGPRHTVSAGSTAFHGP